MKACNPPLPEPVACQWLQNGVMVNAFNHPPREGFDKDGYWAAKGYSKAPLFTEAQLLAYRAEVIEMCSKFVEARFDECEPWVTPDDVRSLK